MGSNKTYWQSASETGNRCLTLSEERKLRQVMRQRRDAARDYAIFRALLTTGMRIGEFLSLTVLEAHVALSSGHLYLAGERRKAKTLPSGQTVYTDLCVHLRGEALEAFADLVRLADDTGPLVPGRNGKPLSARAFQLRLKQWAALAGVDDRLSPHWLRHTFGAEFCRKSVSSPTETCIRLARFLGHADPRTCGHYLTMSRDDDPGAAIEAVWGCKKRQTKAKIKRAFEQARAL